MTRLEAEEFASNVVDRSINTNKPLGVFVNQFKKLTLTSVSSSDFTAKSRRSTQTMLGVFDANADLRVLADNILEVMQ